MTPAHCCHGWLPAARFLPEIMHYEENGVDAIGMDYGKLTPLLAEAVRALRAEKDAEIASLRAEAG